MCSICWQQADHMDIYAVSINTINQVTLQASVLMIEYLIAMSYEIGTVQNVQHF